MKTDAIIDIVSFKNDELTIKANNEADKIRLAQFVQHRRDIYKKNVKAGKNPNYPLIMLNLSDKHKKRTTGKNSQNTKFHGLIRMIADATGQDFGSIKFEIKRYAMEQMNYPIMTDELDNEVWDKVHRCPMPQSEASCTTVEASILIEAVYAFVHDRELDIILP